MLSLASGIVLTIAIVAFCLTTGSALNELKHGSGDIYNWIAYIGGLISGIFTLSMFYAFLTLAEISDNANNILYRINQNQK